MSLVPETWELLHRGTDPKSGLPLAYVARLKSDREDRLTVFKLIRRSNGWYNMGQWISIGRFRRHDFDARLPKHQRPLKLSDSRIDRVLKSLAEQDI